MSRPLQPQHSLDFDDVFDDDITLLANGNCRFIYANATESCKSCSLIGQTCSPIHVAQQTIKSTSGQIQNGAQQIQNGAQQLHNVQTQKLNSGAQNDAPLNQNGTQQISNGAKQMQNVQAQKLNGGGRCVRFSDSVEYSTCSVERYQYQNGYVRDRGSGKVEIGSGVVALTWPRQQNQVLLKPSECINV